MPAVSRVGLIYALAAYTVWGFFPIYWKQVSHFPPAVILGYRVLSSFTFFCVLLAYRGMLKRAFRELRDPRKLALLSLSSLLIGGNWFIYIAAVLGGRITESSLGYFINPLVNALLGMLLLNERLSKLQWLALGLAAAGVAVMTARVGQVPWIALMLAGSFSLYGLLRKRIQVDAATGSAFESGLLCIPALAFVALMWTGHFPALTVHESTPKDAAFLAFGGVLTAVPLLWFAEAAKRLPFSTLGFCQYVAPTLQFLSAVLIYGEPFGEAQQLGFPLIWAACAVFFLDTRLRRGGQSLDARTK